MRKRSDRSHYPSVANVRAPDKQTKTAERRQRPQLIALSFLWRAVLSSNQINQTPKVSLSLNKRSAPMPSTGSTARQATEGGMLINFTCENCGKGFSVDEHSHGKRGRCSNCGHVMRIPGALATDRAHAVASAPAPEIKPESEPAFRLSPPEPPPFVGPLVPPLVVEHVPAHHPAIPQPAAPHQFGFEPGPREPHAREPHVRFELLDDDADNAAIGLASPADHRLVDEIAEFEGDRRGYKVVGDRDGLFSFLRLAGSGPASWPYVKWRAAVSFVLKLLRWIDTWAYLISVPFIMLMVFGIAVENRGFVHMGAVVTVLANYGRFWADLLALFVRPYKDGPIQGLAFLFPPYTVYYVATRWSRMKPILRRIVTSCIPIVLVVLAYAFLPSVNPTVKDEASITSKIEKGKHELDKEINEDLEKIGKELTDFGDRGKPATDPKP